MRSNEPATRRGDHSTGLSAITTPRPPPDPMTRYQQFALSFVYTAVFSPFSIFLLRTYFLAIPKEIQEAAIVDGASRWQIFYKLSLPRVSPGILMVALISGMNTWNEFLISSTFLQSHDQQTAVVRFYTLGGQYSNDWGEIMAA